MASFDGLLALDAIAAVAGQSAEIRAAIQAARHRRFQIATFRRSPGFGDSWPEPVLIFVAVSAR